MAKKIVFTGGGTVGHVTLNLLLIPQFLADGWEVHYIGDAHGIEKKQISDSGLAVTFHAIATGKLRRYFSWQNLLDLFKVSWGVLQSFIILAKIRPQALFSKGGFVSVPPVIAAKSLRIPVYIHESDLSMGLANKIAYRFATTMYTTFEQTGQSDKIHHVGAVTKVAEHTDYDESVLDKVKAQFDSGLRTILFVGGSAGAKVFNDFVSETPELTQRFNVINITGDSSLDELSRNLYRVGYVTDLYQPLLEMADVVVTRGGSNTLFELLAMAKLHVIVPLGREASRGDQLENADYFEKKGYALQVDESSLSLDTVTDAITKLLLDKEVYYKRMQDTSEVRSLDTFYALLLEDMSR